jgi:hypothetical protein
MSEKSGVTAYGTIRVTILLRPGQRVGSVGLICGLRMFQI